MPARPHLLENPAGLWNRGPVDACPPQYLTEAKNLRFRTGAVEARHGSASFGVDAREYSRIDLYRRTGQAPTPISLDSSGAMRDEAADEVIYEDGDMADFVAVTMYDRFFFSPLVESAGVLVPDPASGMQIYTGSGVARAVAGYGPNGENGPYGSSDLSHELGSAGTGLLGLARLPTHETQRIAPGYRVLAVAYQTDTGHITQPGWYTPIAANSPLFNSGATALRISNLPVHPDHAGTAENPGWARVLLSTRLILDPNFRVADFPIYRVPVDPIPTHASGAAVVSFDASFYDTELSTPMTFLVNQLGRIPAGRAVASHENRLVVGGENAHPDRIRASVPGLPESFDDLSGYRTVDPAESTPIQEVVSYRQQLHAFKTNRSYMLNTLGFDTASEWNVSSLDPSVGCSLHGLGRILDRQAGTSDRYFVADNRGILAYSGAFGDEFTASIKDLWDDIDWSRQDKLQLLIDPDRKLLHCLAPFGSDDMKLLVGDYRDQMVRWSEWTYRQIPDIRCIALRADNTRAFQDLVVAGVGALKHDRSRAVNDDDGERIDASLTTAPIGAKDGMVVRLTELGARIGGRDKTPPDAVDVRLLDSPWQTASARTLTLHAQPRMLRIKHDYEAERLRIQVSSAERADNWWSLVRLVPWIAPVHGGYPVDG